MVKFSVVALTTFLTGAFASQDSAYYPGWTNPNTNGEDDLYYREAVNVLQDVQSGEFEALYIQYHGCVWSEYGNGQDNGNDMESGCGGDGLENTWYSGHTQCFRANVAYSLYGVKTDSSIVGDSACSASQYINSFFTTGGIESFGDSTGVGYQEYDASTTCTANSAEGQGDAEGEDNADADGYYGTHNTMIYGDSNSTALGCSTEGAFIMATFKGAYCDGNHFLANEGEVEGLNDDLSALGCLQVYGNGNDQQDGEEDQDGDGQADSASASALLYYSAACSHYEYPETCPDPHGIKKKRDQKLFNTAKSNQRGVPLIFPIITSLLLVGAATFFCFGNGIRDRSKRLAMERATDAAAPDMSIYEHFSESFDRVATGLSVRTRTYTEKLAAYAEEEEEDELTPMVSHSGLDQNDSMIGSYTAPEEVNSAISVEMESDDHAVSIVSAASTEGVRNTTETGTSAPIGISTSTGGTQTDKKYKRPRMAKVAKWIRGRFGRKNRKNKKAMASI